MTGNKYILIVLAVLFTIGCTQREAGLAPADKQLRQFTAHTEVSGDTKTSLAGEVGDSSRVVMWSPDDSIGISTGYKFEMFTNTLSDTSAMAVFQGYISDNRYYYAMYPYDNNAYMSGNVLYFSLPQTQKYSSESFGAEMNPMVSYVSQGEELHFHNLCGVLVLRMTGDFSVKSISFSGKDSLDAPAKVAGNAQVNMGYEEYPELVMGEDAADCVVLDCGEGVVINPSEPTLFYLVLPPATYNSFTVTVVSADGKIFTKEGTKPLTVKRSIVTKSGSFTPVSGEVVNLSLEGTANSYIVSEQGTYSINASIIGNGPSGIVPNAGFHTADPEISPVSAELLWEDKGGIISACGFKAEEKEIIFSTTGKKGNALIAAKDENGTILWNWHIWVTDTPENQTYVNNAGRFEVMDRNLGAISSEKDSGDDSVRDTDGMVYQWGRKDPFAPRLFTRTDAYITYTIKESVENPTHFVGTSTWMNPDNKKLWEPDMKTIYDPCPQGYRVAVSDVWAGFLNGDDQYNKESYNVEGEFDKGWNFIIDSLGTKAWYPVTPLIYYYYYYSGNDYQYRNNGSHIWSSDCNEDENPRALRFYYNDENNMYLNVSSEEDDGHAFPVRCMKDDSLAVSAPQMRVLGVTDTTATSITVAAEIVGASGSEEIKYGFILGVDEDLNTENALQDVGQGNDGRAFFKASFTGLDEFHEYCMRSYIVCESGLEYGDVFKVATLFDGDIMDLSADGTANSYIVSSYGKYKFKVAKGNLSSENLLNVGVADIVWESFGTSEIPKVGDLVRNLTYRDGYIHFDVLNPFKEGNALVAGKEYSWSSYLWSWHIWFTDCPEEHTYPNGTGVFMDRNLGATSASKGDACSHGLFYQWGRKDPFVGNAKATANYNTVGRNDDCIGYGIREPKTFIRRNDRNSDWLFTGKSSVDTTRWGEEKTIYDPCPLGWKVPVGGENGVWKSAGADSVKFDKVGKGVLLPTGNSGADVWFPAAGYLDPDSGKHTQQGITGRYWSTSFDGNRPFDFMFNSKGYSFPVNSDSPAAGQSVRCMKE